MLNFMSLKTKFVQPLWVVFMVAVGTCAANADDSRGIAIDIPTAFNYQGELIFNGQPANGTFEMIFGLFDTPAAGMDFQFAEVTQSVFVTDGWFSTEVDFGDNTFFGARVWLEVIVIDPDTLDVFDRLGSALYAFADGFFHTSGRRCDDFCDLSDGHDLFLK